MNEIPYGYCHCGCGQQTKLAPQTNAKRGWKRGEPMRYVNGHQNAAKTKEPIENRFWSKVAFTSNPDKCWEWQASRTSEGYGTFGAVWPKTMLAHRFAYQVTYGELPDDLKVCHSCDNPACCNPTHLFLGTQKANVEDMRNKGRSWKGGAKSPTKGEVKQLRKNEIISIREQYAQGNITQKALAALYGISAWRVAAIVNGKTWKNKI